MTSTAAVRLQFEQLYREKFPDVETRVARIVKGHASVEDVTTEAFLRLWQQMNRTTVVDPEALVFKIATNLAIDRYRKARRWAAREVPVGLLPDLARMEEEAYASGRALSVPALAEFESFDEVVRELDDVDRDVFILTNLRGLTVRDAAEVLDIDGTAVHRRRHAARNYIRRELF